MEGGCKDEDRKRIARKTTCIIIAIVVTVVITTSVLVPMIVKMTSDKSENGTTTDPIMSTTMSPA